MKLLLKTTWRDIYCLASEWGFCSMHFYLILASLKYIWYIAEFLRRRNFSFWLTEIRVEIIPADSYLHRGIH